MNSGAQRAELHKTIWSIANVLRGSVDGWDFKQYVLGFLFYRFISEDITSYLNEYEHQAGDVDFDYVKLDDATAEQVRKSMVEEKGYFILPSDLFANVRRCADADENLNETLQRVFKNIEGSAIGSRSESSLRGLFDDLDLNSRKLGDTVVDRNAKLVKVLNAIGDLDLGTESFADNKIDAFGGAYEYLCSVFTEIFFGKVFWDYSNIPFNLGGRINLLYCFFWGNAAVVWFKSLYPPLEKWIERIPRKVGKIITWGLLVFMCCNIMVSCMALVRYDERKKGIRAETRWEHWTDEHYDDVKMKKIYPNAKGVKKEKTEEKDAGSKAAES